MFGENGPDFGAASDGMFKDHEKCTWLFCVHVTCICGHLLCPCFFDLKIKCLKEL